MQTQFKRVEHALLALQQGKMIILTDDPERENEGDLICAAEKITTAQMNFMIREGTGIVCLSLTNERLQQLQIPLMVSSQENTSLRGTPFTISIDARDGITTGVSAEDRVTTIAAVMNEATTAQGIVKPGHIFPLLAREGGVLERQGHTEGAVDLAKLAGFKPAAVLCEIMNSDGSMARGQQLNAFAEKHQLLQLSIADIMAYRLYKENMIEEKTTATLPLEKYGTFDITVFKDKISGKEHFALFKNTGDNPPLVRIHSSCITGDLFSSERCDCHQQLHYSLEKIAEEGGILIYLDQEGRGIGLFNKIKAYALQENGCNTIEANERLGLPIDAREYYIAAHFLQHLQIHEIRLLTNNPQKIQALAQYDIQVTQELMPAFLQKHNQFYLMTKKEKLNHTLKF
ncbi:MAG: 3,4-dihydroxy-2-butanone-4-phosphate synthase [Gammaproteobacteria bacterium]|nr:3,4-dihydroxy-2-butanone-4-phosphate synthase [Gammaproteobacteria bacterium]